MIAKPINMKMKNSFEKETVCPKRLTESWVNFPPDRARILNESAQAPVAK